MGKVDFLSHKVQLGVPSEKAFAFLSDLNNLEHLMPEQVINWQSTETSCSFDIKGMAHINLERAETVPYKMIRISSGTDNPIDIEFRCNLEPVLTDQTTAWIELTADLSPMLKMLASGPMQNLVNIMADKLSAEGLELGA
jgi:carbon monoxide dehydrogenase subunit G